MRREIERLVTIGFVCLVSVFIGTASARQTSTSSTETKAFEVISVVGNQLVVRVPDGTKEYTVPDAFRFTVDGKQLSVHELKAGMKGTATVTTITTVKPVTVTEVRNGTVMQRNGNSIIVRTPDGIRMFSEGDVDRRAATLVRNGQPASITDFRAGDRLTATIITEKPPMVMTEREVTASLAKAAPATAPAAAPAGGAARPAPAPAGTMAAPAPAAGTAGAADAGAGAGGARRLPKTASSLPLIGLLGGVSLAIGAGLTLMRRRALL